MRSLFTSLTFIALLSVSAACGGDQSESDSDPEPEVSVEPAVTVRIVEPAEGGTVGSDVRVVLVTEGIEIVPITPPIPGTGHHHLYLDADVVAWDEVIPAGDPMIVHKGDGSTEHTFEGVAPGPHRIISVVANPAHIPIAPNVADTVNFTVGN